MITVNDKEYIMDILESEKNLSVNMTYALNEASCDKLYKSYLKMFENINKKVKEIFDLSYKLGFYKLEKEEGKKIKSTIKTLTQDLNSSSSDESTK